MTQRAHPPGKPPQPKAKIMQDSRFLSKPSRFYLPSSISLTQLKSRDGVVEMATSAVFILDAKVCQCYTAPMITHI